MTTGSLLLLSSLFLGMGVFDFDGLYSPFTFTWMMLGFTALVLAALGYLRMIKIAIALPTENMLVSSFLFLLYITIFKMPGTQDITSIANEFFLSHLYLIVFFCLIFFFIPKSSSVIKHILLLSAFVTAVLLRIWMIQAAPSPQIDVFSATTHAVEVFLTTGKSPYVPDDSGIVPLFYPPLNFYLHLSSYWIFGDVRGIYVLAEIVFSVSLWWGAKRGIGSISAMLLACIFLFQPRSLYILQMGWTEPPILALIGVSILFFLRSRPIVAAVSYGLAISLKQYLVFFIIHWLLLDRSWKHFIIMLVAAFATVIPFIILAPEYLLENGFFETLRGGVRSDSLTFTTFLSRHTGILLPKMMSLFIGLIMSLVTFRVFQNSPPLPAFLFSSAISTFALFLFGGQAFANYYYVVSGIVLLLIAHHTTAEEYA